MSFPRYLDYKDSGVEWLGEVPAHWEMKRLKHISPFITVGIVVNPSTFVADDGLPFIYGGDIREGVIDWENARRIDAASSEANTKTMLKAGDLLTVRVGAPGVTAVVPKECEGGNCASVMLIRGGEYNSEWLCFAMNTRVVRFQVEIAQYGAAQEQFNISHAVNFWVPTPPLAEQDAIAAFLGRETAKIDALVAEQQRLIELLKEKRQAVISHAVTKGLKLDATMKPSGVEWLGEVPAHWEVVPLRHSITKVEQGWSPQCLGEPAPEGEWGVLKVGCGNGDKFDPREQKALPSDVAPLEQYEVKSGDILMSRGNTLELVGMATLVPEVRRRLLLSDLLYRFRALSWCVDPEFLVLSLRSRGVRFQIERDATGTSPSMKKIGQATVMSLVIPRPSLAEQRAIVGYIREQTDKLDLLAVEAQRAIDLLQERRAALISAAVTGQIDVRAASERAAA